MAKEVLYAYAKSSHAQYIQCAIDLFLLALIIIGFCAGWHFLKRIMIKNAEDKAALPGIIDKQLEPKLKTLEMTITALKDVTELKHAGLQTHVVYNQGLLQTMFGKIVRQTPPPAPEID
jgi:hypothetical protein